MAKRKDIKKILLIGSGPIVIGQGAEFDYAGTQACLALKEEGYEVILCNSNPATIMTDSSVADKVYMEPLTPEAIAKILRSERPDAIVPGFGGQTGLNLAVELERKGVLKEYGVQLLGTPVESIERAENRKLFKEMCLSIGEPVIPSEIAYSLEEAKKAARKIGYPVVLRPAFTLGGTGGGFADDEAELTEIGTNSFRLSPVHQVLVEKSVRGYKEIEFEVMRDSADNVIAVCGMENLDPVGVHTGDSVVVAPILSLNDGDRTRLRDSAVRLIRGLKIEGGCNVQFALNPESGEYFIIEVNPRVSRSSALASKASGYPIARVSAKVAAGMLLGEISLPGGTAATEPSFDYFVAKFPRFPFDKFPDASNLLGIQMKATGEVMGIGSNPEECLLKAVRSLETGVCHLYLEKFDSMTTGEIEAYLSGFRADGIFGIVELIRRGVPLERIHGLTKISPFFLESFVKIVSMEKELTNHIGDTGTLKAAKVLGFSDKYIGELWNMTETAVYETRRKNRIMPFFHRIDSFRTGKPIACFYSSYTGKNESLRTDRKKIAVLGAGPIRIGQGIEFDYSAVHAAKTIRRRGYEAIIINNNPETVSTDYTTADKLYFEPLTPEDIMAVLDFEQPEGVVVSLGGQTALNLARPLTERGARIIGTGYSAIRKTENRDCFEKVLTELGIPKPKGKAVTKVEEGIAVAAEIGYPVLVRPSFVLGGRAMQLVQTDDQLRHCLKTTVEIDEDKPVLIDRYIAGKEVEVDAVSDGKEVFIPGIMELVERTGIHSGDSISVFPPFSISDKAKETILRYTEMLGRSLGITGLYNIQFVVDRNDEVSVIEVNPRSSRTVPFLSKATGYSLADIATEAILGKSLREQGILSLYPGERNLRYVKVPVFSFGKIKGMDPCLSPEMKSTGEVIGCDETRNRAMYKAFVAAGICLRNSGTVLLSIQDADKEEVLPFVRRFCSMGFSMEATPETAAFLAQQEIPVRVLRNISGGSNGITESIRSGHVTYVISTSPVSSGVPSDDGVSIRLCATENNVPVFTCLDTVRVFLDVLEEAKKPV